MEYILELSFWDKPNCNGCVLSGTKGLDLNGESVIACYGLSRRLKCPEEGCREDCPLKQGEEFTELKEEISELKMELYQASGGEI